MLRTIQLILPALIPSWRFFDVIAPSPRIEYRRLRARDDDDAEGWRAWRPRPAHVSLGTMLARLFWNPGWNESLFAVSCAERLLDEPTDQSRDEIFRRIASDLQATDRDGFLQFRLVVRARNGDAVTSDIAYVSERRSLADIAKP